MCLHIWQKTLDLIIGSFADFEYRFQKERNTSRPVLILPTPFFREFLLSPVPVVLFFSSRTSPCYLSCFLFPKFFSPFAMFLSMFSLTVSPVPVFAPSLPPSLSLFHFTIVEGKIMYLSAAFLLPPLLSVATCSTLPCNWRRPLGRFSLVSQEEYVSRCKPCSKTIRGCRLVVYLFACVTCKQQEQLNKIFILKIGQIDA